MAKHQGPPSIVRVRKLKYIKTNLLSIITLLIALLSLAKSYGLM